MQRSVVSEKIRGGVEPDLATGRARFHLPLMVGR